MKNEIAPGFSLRLLEKLKEQGMTQADLRKRTGLTTSMISYYCTGKRFPSVTAAIKIAKALNTTVEYLALGVSPEESQAGVVAEEAIPYINSTIQTEYEIKALVSFYHAFNKEGKEKVLAYVEDLALTEKYN